MELKPKNKYLFKASWRGTAHKFWIEAPDYPAAQKKAERQISKMEGYQTCLGIELLGVQIRKNTYPDQETS